MKPCPYCAEEIQDEAIRCKHCHEYLDGRKNSEPTPSTQEDSRFDAYIEFLHQYYPSYHVVSKNLKENYLILNAEQSNFSCAVCFVLLLLGILPGLLYAIVAGNGKHISSVTVYFDQSGNPTHANRGNFHWLVSGFTKWKQTNQK